MGNAAYFHVWPWLLCSFPSDPLLRRISSFYLWRDLGKLGRGVKRWQWWSGLTGSGLVNTQPPPSLPHLPHHSQADVMQPAMVVAPCNPSPTISVAGHHTTIPSEGNSPTPITVDGLEILVYIQQPNCTDLLHMAICAI